MNINKGGFSGNIKIIWLIIALVMLAGTVYSEKSGFLTIDLSPEKELAPAAPAEGETPIGYDLWLGLSASIQVFKINMQTRDYSVGLIPGIGYGIKWKPEFWTLSEALLGLDLF